jgi:hypothetical protein
MRKLILVAVAAMGLLFASEGAMPSVASANHKVVRHHRAHHAKVAHHHFRKPHHIHK